ncbi:crotonobetainyl-CoA:carnitine CoA-transferase CaiB-like acyl-CoA transferase [Enterovirga rhinocerotis]|uniref:Crotonobetainyl-CoA:carnitine CoA-transferase CaiB-like acyl-CoA transferase n=2 Tax=Enterovirga rhinocerotis TaxID=1339210 RepID=A0A4R7C9J6_9HYPH|nr:CaiB/BaiF CoA-transferase family protein [Enterovirga rhinocerotis]TDR94973.1 crotonobetainyl-CoA:carnitine CoA-transferase CaiB-like acyl-CoA transferase [Enterovirga rhinocerotis]
MTSPKPLAGIRVLELARILAGPWCGQNLADLGADVVKVERPGAGDDTRSWGPPFVEAEAGGDLSAGYYHATNRGKRSITVEMDTPEGQATIRRLASKADILLENFKVGGLKKYGLDYASLSALNPRLIYCSVTGFGQDGPYAHRGGYDFMIQGMSGIMSITGEPEGEPMKTAVAFADVFTGMYATTAVLAALQGRQNTGRGCHIDMALFDTQIAVMGNQAMIQLLTGAPPPRFGNAHSSVVPYQVFPTSDGHIVIACGNDGQFRRLCGVLGTVWADDERYATNPARIVHRGTLIPLLMAETAKWTKADLLAAFEREVVPAGPINTLPEVFADPQVIHRRMTFDLDEPAAKGGKVPTLRGPIVVDGEPMVGRTASPGLGQHTDEVLADPNWS